MTDSRRIARWLAFLALIALSACSVSEDLTENERATLLTEADFRPFGLSAPPGEGGKYRKTINRFDRSHELSYVFEREGYPFYLSNTLTVDSSSTNAVITEGAQKTGLLIGLKANGVDEQPMTLRTKYGDRSSLTLLTKDGKPVGNVFSALAGKKVFVAVFSGIYFNDAAEFHRLIGEKVDAILRYDADAR